MLCLATRILMVALIVYSYLDVKTRVHAGNFIIESGLAVFLLIQVLVSGLFFVIPYFPEAVHFGSRTLRDYSPKQLDRITPLLRDMTGLMGLLFTLYFAVTIHLMIAQALSPRPHAVARTIGIYAPWLTAGLLIGEGAIIFYYLRRFDVAAGDK